MANLIVFEDSYIFDLLCSIYTKVKNIHSDWVIWDRTGHNSAIIIEKGATIRENKNLFSVQVLASKIDESLVLVWLRGENIDRVLLYEIAKKINSDTRLDGRIKIILA